MEQPRPAEVELQPNAGSSEKPSTRLKTKNRVDRSTLVETLVVLPGNFGGNNLLMQTSKLRPEQVPGMDFLYVDADGSLMRDRLAQPSKNLKEWLKSRRMHIIRLASWARGKKAAAVQETPGDGETYRHHGKVFGAGGKPKMGRKALEPVLPKIEALIDRKNLVILWLCGGGGIGTAVAEEVLQITKTKKIPLITLLTTPEDDDHKKIATCAKLREDLRSYGRVNVFYNSKAMEDPRITADPNLTTQGLYEKINENNQVVFRHDIELTQRIGDTDNADFSDMLSAFETGPDVYCGAFDVQLGENGEVPELNVTEIVDGIMSHPCQDTDIVASAMIPAFVGPWPVIKRREIVRLLRERTKAEPGMMYKVQSREKTKGEMWVSVLIVGRYPEKTRSDVSTTAAETVPTPPPVPEPARVVSMPSKPAVVPSLHIVEMAYLSGGREVDEHVPSSLRDDWQVEVRKPNPDSNRIMELKDRFRKLGKPVPDFKEFEESEPCAV